MSRLPQRAYRLPHLDRVIACVTARSYHRGGVNALFLDGSIHFVNNDIARDVWRALGTRSGA